MSLKAEKFYALQCDFPECGVLWEGYEYTYYADGPDTSDAEDDGWYVDQRTNEAYCTVHTIVIECPPEAFTTSPTGDRYCQWCEDHGDPHMIPMPDTWVNRLQVATTRVTDKAHRHLDYLEQEVCGNHGKLGVRGNYAMEVDRALTKIHEKTCRAWKPEITGQELFDLKSGRQR